MSNHTVHVSNLAPNTTEQQLHDFFAFCGKIQSIEFRPETQSAEIHFEKPSAAKTALMLNGGSIDGSHITVTSDIQHRDEEPHPTERGIDQTDKPRAGIAAEYLAKGYKLSDQILQRAIELDHERGISNKFLSYIQSLDSKLGEKTLGPEKTISGKLQETLAQAKSVDEQKGYTKLATDYYSRALSSPLGQKVRDFYTTTSKQVLDIHEEARRIADLHKGQGQPQQAGAPPGSSEQKPSGEAPGSSAVEKAGQAAT